MKTTSATQGRSAPQRRDSSAKTRVDYSRIIDQYSRRRLKAYWAGKQHGDTAYRSLKRLTGRTAAEYEGRFLFELIQNAHDAHPEDGDGTIHVLLDRDEEAHGVLYVANAGRPFTESNFEAICNLAQSDKPPGENIGNKGIGFKSVLQVCRWPEIYSAVEAEPAERFEGFCFGFAHDGDVRALVGGDEERFKQVRDDISPYFLPVVADSQDAQVRAFAQRGMATVIRLPLRVANATVLVDERLDRLHRSEAPVLLFLPRIQRLVLESRGGNRGDQATELERVASELEESASDPPVRLMFVDLGEQGRYLTSSLAVDRERVVASIESSIQAEQLEEEWADWEGDADVSVAARLDTALDSGTKFTFLPMEEEMPFAGHLNAPFVTKLARTAVSESIELNRMLMDAVAELCVRTILILRALGDESWADAIVDLLAWDETGAPRIAAAFESLGRDLRSEVVIPAVKADEGGRWSSLEHVWTWPDADHEVLTSELLATAANVDLVQPGLGAARIARLEQFAGAAADSTLEPSAESVADWCEAVAAHMRPRHAFSTWDRFYDDLATCFEHSEDALVGRRLLLDEDRKLRLCGKTREEGDLSDEPVVFFQPKARSADEDDVDEEIDVAIPPALKRAVCFMHPDLSWHVQEGTTRRNKPSRDFFRNSGLIQPYKTRALLDRLADVLASTGHHGVHGAALRWLFNLQRATHIDEEFLEALPARVPTRKGWREAQEAFLGRGWGDAAGGELETIATNGRKFVDDLAALEERLVQPPGSWPDPIEPPEPWRRFLQRLGVRNGLWPIDGPGPQRLPGLDESWKLPDSTRQRYAALVVSGLGEWDDPSVAALATSLSGAWLPVEQADGGVTFSEPQEAWHIDYGERTLSGIPVVTRPIRRILTDSEGTLDRLVDLGMAVWGRVADSARQLVLQGELLALGLIGDAELMTFRNSYRDAWQTMGQLETKRPFADYEQINLAVTTGGSIEYRQVAIGPEESGDPIYVQDVDDELTAHLLQRLGQPVLLTEKGAKDATRILASELGDRVRPVSDAQVAVSIEGRLFEPSEDAPRLVAEPRGWLPVFVACTVEFPHDRFVRIGGKQRESALVRLEHARLVATEDLAVELDGVAVKPPRAIAFDHVRFPTLITSLPTIDLTLGDLARLAPFIADLIGLERLRSELELSLGRLSRVAAEDAGPLEIADVHLAEVFEVDEPRILEVRRWVEGALGPLLELLIPVVAHLVGHSAAEAIDQRSQGATSVDEVTNLVEAYSEALPISAQELVRKCQEASGLADLRDRLGLDYAEFNATLERMGSPYAPLIDPEAHRSAFEAFKQEHRDQILGSLRMAYLDDFRARRSLDSYVPARNLEGVGPDPEWLTEMAVPSDDRMTERIDAWLADHGGASMLASPPDLMPRDEVVRENGETVDRLAEQLRDVIPAWCSKNNDVPPAPWDVREGAVEQVRVLAGQAGVLDFEPIADERIIALLVERDAWPQGMPATADLDRLDLAADEVERQSEERERERRESEFRQRSIELGEKRMSAERENYLRIAQLVHASITEEFLTTSIRRASLEELPPARRGDQRSGGSGRGRRPEPTKVQREAIGFVGEVAAFEWLRAHYPELTAENWKSTYREILYPGEPGDDSLGYDFEVVQKTQTLYFEVKAGGDATEFDFGESQVSMAGRCARKDNYRILFVHHALDPDRRRVLVLPNPVGPRGRDLFRLRRGVRYEFRLQS